MSLSLSARQRRELWGLALFALAILLALSLFPLALVGEPTAGLFPSGNVVGVIGRSIAGASWWVFGAVGLLLPVLPALWGAVALGKLHSAVAFRWTLLVGGLVLLVPTGWYVIARPVVGSSSGAGWLGAALGAPLTAWFGWVGALLLIGFLLAALCVATLEWNPIRTVADGGRSAWAGFRRLPGPRPLIARAGATLAALRQRRGEHAAIDEGDTLVEGPAVLGPVAAYESGADAPPGSAAVPVGAVAAPAGTRARRKADSAQLALITEDPGDPLAADFPPTSLLTAPAPQDIASSRRQLDDLGRVLIDKLATFKIPGEVVGMTVGPVVTQFEISPAPGIKVARIASLEADLALAMRAPSIRIIAPIPGKAAVGVEVPNPAPEMVYFREVLESAAFRHARGLLPVALGKDISGNPFITDLAKAPHLLIAGATGSGKSVCVNTIVTSLVYRHSPQTLRLLMVDPKMVELSMYNDLPHLRHPVVTANSEAAGVLKWAVIEMERRYQLLSANGVRNVQDFNKRLETGQVMRSLEAEGEEGDPDRWIYQGGPLPFVVVIIDELADLMMTVQGEVEKPLALLAQKARAIGIHLILATQRPSVNVITGLIKANFPSRMAFRVSSKVDSRTILDQNGADALLGNGDMLFLPPGRSDPVRIQGAFLSTEDTERLMEWYRERAQLRKTRAAEQGENVEGLAGEQDILEIVRSSEADFGESDDFDAAPEDRDKLFREAALLCIQHQGGSTSLLQRRLRIGYGRAARIIDQLHHAGVLGPPDGSKPREVLVDILGLEQVCPDD
jgi:DNA segregation ATPase FtsK/SpoIIIE, S-DNA-T family